MLRERAGIIDISNFAKYLCKGPGAADWLNALFANHMPSAVGRSCLTPLIGRRGGIAGDFTVTRLAEEEFLIIGSGMAERYHTRFFRQVPLPEDTSFQPMTEELCGFNVAGPQSRALLQKLTDTSLATADFPFMRSKRISLGGVEAVALRVSFTGDLGWELHCRAEDQAQLYRALLQAGRDLDVGPVGSRALMSLRIEKGYGSWSREYGPEYWPHEVGLDRLCRLDKDFLNKEPAIEVLARPKREELVLLHLDEEAVRRSNADATGGEPIFRDGEGVGRVTSGAYGYSVGLSLALGFVKNPRPGDRVDVMVLGRPHPATILAKPPFDADGKRLRA